MPFFVCFHLIFKNKNNFHSNKYRQKAAIGGKKAKKY